MGVGAEGTSRLGPADLLALWERAGGLRPVPRALALAEAAGADPALLDDLPLGETHRAVLTFRSHVLGPDATATANCPRCDTRVEFGLDVPALLDLDRHAPAGPATARVDGYVVTWRPPTPGDLAACLTEPDPVGALRDRCLLAVRPAPDGDGRDADRLPPEVLDEVESAMAEADPLAEVLVALTCPTCHAGFDCDVDIAAFVWAELDARARLLLHEVDLLARVYGWTEPDVLALSDARRGAYLRIVLGDEP